MHPGDSNIPTLPASATWMNHREQEPAPGEDPGPAARRRRRAPVVGKRTELARYAVAEGQRIRYGQRIDGIVRFLAGSLAVLVSLLGPTEDRTCRSRTTIGAEGCTKAVRRKRRNGASEPRCPAAREREDAS
jgi:hypothetical protein